MLCTCATAGWYGVGRVSTHPSITILSPDSVPIAILSDTVPITGYKFVSHNDFVFSIVFFFVSMDAAIFCVLFSIGVSFQVQTMFPL